MEKENMENEEKAAEKTQTEKKDRLILELKTPVEYKGTKITQLDLRGLREMKGGELNTVYDLYSAQGGSDLVMQEATLLFAQILASRVSGYQLEAIMEIKARDSVLLKNRVYGFFFLWA